MPWSDAHHQPGTDARLADLEKSHFSSMSRSQLLVFSWFNGPTTLTVTIPLWSCVTNNLFHSMLLGEVLRGERRICWVALRPILAQWACGGHVWFEYRHWHGALPMRGAFHGRSNILQTLCQRLFSSHELWLLVLLGHWHFQFVFMKSRHRYKVKWHLVINGGDPPELYFVNKRSKLQIILIAAEHILLP